MVFTTSTSFIIGTGLKKCRPMKRSGRLVAVISSVTEMDEVLVAKIASFFTMRVELRVGLALLVDVLDDGLDHDVAVGEVLHVGRALQTRLRFASSARR